MNIVESKPHTFLLSKLINRLKLLLENYYAMQMNGSLFIPQNVSYALSRNYAMVYSLHRHYLRYRDGLLEDYAVKSEDGKSFKRSEDDTEWLFKSTEAKSEFSRKLTDYQLQDVPWQPYKIFEGDLKAVQNLPITAFAELDEFGIVTEVEIITAPTQPLKRA